MGLAPPSETAWFQTSSRAGVDQTSQTSLSPSVGGSRFLSVSLLSFPEKRKKNEKKSLEIVDVSDRKKKHQVEMWWKLLVSCSSVHCFFSSLLLYFCLRGGKHFLFCFVLLDEM